MLPVFTGDLGVGSRDHVRLIQEWLCLNGFATAIDGDYGPATARAVLKFQGAHGLPPTGVVNRTTFDLLLAPVRRVLAPITPLTAETRDLGQMIVQYARQHLNERPREVGGQNRGPWVRLYMDGRDGTPFAWCAGFACFVLRQACEALDRPMPIAREIACDRLAAAATKARLFVGEHDRAASTISPGSFFLIRRTSTDWTHVGIVTRAGAEEMETIEGNTNDEGSREGYEVCARHRSYRSTDFILFA